MGESAMAGREMMEPHDYLIRPYTRRVVRDSDGTFFAQIVEFPGCYATGDTEAAALAVLEEVAVSWIMATIEQGLNVPEPGLPPSPRKRRARYSDGGSSGI